MPHVRRLKKKMVETIHFALWKMLLLRGRESLGYPAFANTPFLESRILREQEMTMTAFN